MTTFRVEFDAFATGELGSSEPAASRRIEAMRAMRDVAELEPKIESGEPTLSNVVQARVAIRNHERKTKVSPGKKRGVLLSVAGLSKRQAEKTLARELPPAQVSSRSERPTRYFSAKTKREVWQKAQGQCEFPADDGKRCEVRHGLEFDHRKPYVRLAQVISQMRGYFVASTIRLKRFDTWAARRWLHTFLGSRAKSETGSSSCRLGTFKKYRGAIAELWGYSVQSIGAFETGRW